MSPPNRQSMQYPWSGKTPMHVCNYNGIDRITWLWLGTRTSYVFYLHIFFSKNQFFFYTGWSIFCFHIFRLKKFRLSKKVMVIYWRDSLLLISCKVCTFVCFYFIKSSLDKFRNWLNISCEIRRSLKLFINTSFDRN